MASTFQHRLVGTIILVAIGIIFLPDLLDGQKVTYRENAASIPLRPALVELAEPVNFESFDNEVAELLIEPAPTVNLTEAKKVESAAPKPITKAPKLVPLVKAVEIVKVIPPVGHSWNIRLGTFKNSVAVDDLVEKIRKAGFDAYRLPRHKQAGQLNRLYVGPNVNKNELKRLLPKLQKITGLKGVIEKFDPRDK
ncbi:SPOR domain-containing protein [Moritella viscosa]|uniref:DedD protein n=1 Tax=Moritella viscosa TaxID=80854 RepID=A0A1L0A905_9GAMM|nr:SPOR domain-containing protein [Moritella viscosa]SGY95537.1 DedD protein [Moritella viscosa]SGZ01378.1 DedD protein [Moritella viscosa]SGZ07555.1 DedD protein [Moritella viscosa]SGZ07704.1 DedD protein [Moritella viscosa]SHO09990.1 DedD protein [Moritella viscosa]